MADFGGENEGTCGSLSCQKYGQILLRSGSGPQILSWLSSPAKSPKVVARFTEESQSMYQCHGDLIGVICVQPTFGYEPPDHTMSDVDAIG